MLCHYDGTIVPYTNNSFTYINENIVFLNATGGMLLEKPKKLYVADLRLNCNDVEIDITWRSLVEEH